MWGLISLKIKPSGLHPRGRPPGSVQALPYPSGCRLCSKLSPSLDHWQTEPFALRKMSVSFLCVTQFKSLSVVTSAEKKEK